MLEKERGEGQQQMPHRPPRPACSEEEEARKLSQLPGKAGRLVVQKVAVSVQSGTALKHRSVHSGTD